MPKFKLSSRDEDIQLSAPEGLRFRVGSDAGYISEVPEEEPEEIEQTSPVRFKVGAAAEASETYSIQASKALDGSVIVADHVDIDIILRPSTYTILTLPKKTLNNVVYASQRRLFKHLYERGIVGPESIRGGALYGSLEGKILSEEPKALALALLNISKWLNDEQSYMDAIRQTAEDEEERVLEPDDQHSTDAGEVAHAETKGSIRGGGPYGQTGRGREYH